MIDDKTFDIVDQSSEAYEKDHERQQMGAELKPWQFQPGNPGGGRPPGSRSKLSESFLQALASDFVQHGPSVIEQVRRERPHHYLSVIASLCPRQLHVERSSPFEHLSDAEIDLLEETLRAGRARLVPEPTDTNQHSS